MIKRYLSIPQTGIGSRRGWGFLAIFLGLMLPWGGNAAERPFVMWNKGDLEAIKERIESEEWARQRWEAEPSNWAEEALRDLLAYRLYDDKGSGLKQKKALMGDIRSDPPLGGAQWVNVVRFDMLYPLLSKAERDTVEKVFRRYIRHAIFENALYDPEIFNDEANYSRYDANFYERDNWLPNIVWPRRVSANLMAAALGDEALIRKTWSHYGSWQWYFDTYLADSGFYGEEFSKMGASPGAMLVYCRAVENLGLNELGFGYKGRSGATMRGHIRSVIRIGYPRIKLHSGRPQYPKVTMGDLRGAGSSAAEEWPTFAFQHSIAPGYLPDGFGGANFWEAHGAWGGTRRGDHKQWDGYSGFTPKMMTPFWFEQAHARWPEDGYGYFLYHMRRLNQERYVPSLYFGVSPLGADDVTPPPALSRVAPERGLVLLRADESSGHWESDAPAVAMRLASPYAHSVRDSYALLGLYAYNRPIYLNRAVTEGYAESWTRSILSHAGVMVDRQQPGFTYAGTVRDGYYSDVKFVASKSGEVFEGIDLTRGLFLTDQYLYDVTHLADRKGRKRDYRWMVHALGNAPLSDRWSQSHDLGIPLDAFGTARSRTTDERWEVKVVQTCGLEDANRARLPERWYDREVGVRLSMLGGQETRAHVAPTPVTDDPSDAPPVTKKPQMYEVGGTSVIAHREAPATTFAALHEPFEGGKGENYKIQPISRKAGQLAVKVTGNGVDDRLLFKWRDVSKAVTAKSQGESFTFVNHGFVRITDEAVRAFGHIQRLAIPVDSQKVAFYLNDRLTPAAIEDGILVYEE